MLTIVIIFLPDIIYENSQLFFKQYKLQIRQFKGAKLEYDE